MQVPRVEVGGGDHQAAWLKQHGHRWYRVDRSAFTIRSTAARIGGGNVGVILVAVVVEYSVRS